MSARTCKYCYSVVLGDGECPQCAKEHAKHMHRDWPTNTRRGRPTLDVQEGNREEYFGDSYE